MTKKQIFTIAICLCLLSSKGLIGITKSITNPQSMMVGARSISLGLNPALYGDLGHSILNPATNAGINQLPFSVTSQQLLGEFNYLVVGTGLPGSIKFRRKGDYYRKEFGISLSYSNLSINKVPKTINQDGLPYQIGEFSAGYHFVHLGFGTNFYNKLAINKISLGTAIKTLTYYVDSSTASTVGIDVGVIAMRYIDYKVISSLEFGAVIHNALSPGMAMKQTGNTLKLPFEMILGSKLNLWDDRLSLLSSINNLGFSIGSEFEIEEGVFIRGSTNQKDIKVGLGITLDNIPTGVSTYGFKGRLDFNYTQSAFPMNNNPTYILSLASLGRSIPRKPEILMPRKPVQLISKNTINLSGVGPKNTTIRIYNNDKFKKSIQTNKFGDWKIKNFALGEGRNNIYIKSYDMSKDLSLDSNSVTIISDRTPPNLNVTLFPDNSVLKVEIESNEILANISAEIDGRKIRLKEDDSQLKEKKVVEEDMEQDSIISIFLGENQKEMIYI